MLDKDILIIRPNLENYKTSDFKNFDEIVACGSETAQEAIKAWKKKGIIRKNTIKIRRSSIKVVKKRIIKWNIDQNVMNAL